VHGKISQALTILSGNEQPTQLNWHAKFYTLEWAVPWYYGSETRPMK